MSQLQSLSSGSEASGKSSQPEYVNSIFGLVQNGQEALEGNDEQKAKATVNIIEGLLSMVSFSKNQTAQANKEVKNNADDINKNQADADKKAKAILSDAAILREKERISYEEERSDKINSYHDELKKSGEEHYSATTAECNAVITRLDDEFSKNKERWTDEIYKSIVSVN